MEKWMVGSVRAPTTRRGRALRGMVRERVGIVRRCFDAWRTTGFDSLRHHVDMGVEVDWSEARAPYRGMYSGHAGWRRLFDDVEARVDHVPAEPDEFVIAGQHIAVPNTTRTRDGAEVVARSTFVFTFRGVKLVALRLYQNEADALAAIGVVGA